MVASSPFLCPSQLRRSLARSRETRFTHPNRRACSQARLLIATSTNRFQDGWCKSKLLGPGALFRARPHWTPCPCIRIHVVPPFADGKDPLYCLQINWNVSWEWRTLEGNLQFFKETNLRLNGYSLEESAFNRVSVHVLLRITEHENENFRWQN